MNITEAAGAYLVAVLETARAAKGAAIRLRVQDNTIESTLDTWHAGDEAFDRNGRTILILDAGASDYLADSMLDIEETPDGPKLLIMQ